MNNYLDSVVGQERVIEILSNFIRSEQLPHAMLFSGPKNVGQHYTAKQLLKELLAKNNANSGWFIQVDKLEEPLVKYIIPLPRGKGEKADDHSVEKLHDSEIEILQEEINKKIKNSFYQISLENANNIKITSIRDIKKYLSFNYSDLPYRLILIEDAHLMGVEAQNALLKSLEEPPHGVFFVLITDKPEFLLSTIKSRCWEIPFAPLHDKDVEYILINNFDFNKDDVHKVIQFAEGSIYKVFELLNNDFEELLDTTINILRYSLANKYNTSIKLFTNIIDNNPKIIFELIIQLMINWFNDVQKIKAGDKNIHFIGYEDTVEKFVQKFPDTKIDEIIFKLTELRKNIEYNINLNLLVLNIIFNISSLVKR